jgi:hypothetical protein
MTLNCSVLHMLILIATTQMQMHVAQLRRLQMLYATNANTATQLGVPCITSIEKASLDLYSMSNIAETLKEKTTKYM